MVSECWLLHDDMRSADDSKDAFAAFDVLDKQIHDVSIAEFIRGAGNLVKEGVPFGRVKPLLWYTRVGAVARKVARVYFLNFSGRSWRSAQTRGSKINREYAIQLTLNASSSGALGELHDRVQDEEKLHLVT